MATPLVWGQAAVTLTLSVGCPLGGGKEAKRIPSRLPVLPRSSISGQLRRAAEVHLRTPSLDIGKRTLAPAEPSRRVTHRREKSKMPPWVSLDFCLGKPQAFSVPWRPTSTDTGQIEMGSESTINRYIPRRRNWTSPSEDHRIEHRAQHLVHTSVHGVGDLHLQMILRVELPHIRHLIRVLSCTHAHTVIRLDDLYLTSGSETPNNSGSRKNTDPTLAPCVGHPLHEALRTAISHLI